MKTNERGVDLIIEFEDERLKAYPDPGTGGEPWTIGVGHTKGVTRGMTITKAQSRKFLEDDLSEKEAGVLRALDGEPVTGNEFAAMVSLAFNIGVSAFAKSSVLKAHKRGDKAAAAGAFKLWNKANGKVLNGLVRRRAAEAALYMLPEVQTPAVETRTTPDPEKKVGTSKTVIGSVGIAVAGAGQTIVENVPSLQAAHATVQQTGGFEWVARAIGFLIVLGALFIAWQQFVKRRKGEG